MELQQTLELVPSSHCEKLSFSFAQNSFHLVRAEPIFERW